jgi:hypothetical protein
MAIFWAVDIFRWVTVDLSSFWERILVIIVKQLFMKNIAKEDMNDRRVIKFFIESFFRSFLYWFFISNLFLFFRDLYIYIYIYIYVFFLNL